MRERVVTSSVAAATGAALAAAAVCALRDVLMAGGGHGVALVIAGLWAIPGLAVGLAFGAVAAAWRLTVGEHALRRLFGRLADDRAFDREVTGAIAAAAIAATAYAGLMAILARRLVASTQRAEVGAMLLGIAAVVALPVAAAAALPLFRLTRRAAAAVPRTRRVPAALVLVAIIALTGLAGVVSIATTRLDWRALDLPLYRTIALYGAAMTVWVGLLYGLIPTLRLRVRRRGAVALAAAAVAAVTALLALRAQPTPAAALRVANHTGGARVLLSAARAMSDADGDGYSALLGGPDCDDHAAGVHPGAREIPGNGVDDNCLGGDRVVRARSHHTAPTRPAAAAPQWNGNVLVILVDTTRADRMGVAGYRRGGKSITPHIDALARRGAYFTHAWAQAPNTARSIPSFMTSRFPSQVRVDKQFKNFPVTGDDNPLLFAALREAGFHTMAFASHYYFQVNPGIRHGFDEVDNRGAVAMEKDANEVAAPRIVPRAVHALERMAGSKQRFAMFVHLFEPHSSYVRHPGLTHGGRMSDRYDGEIEFVDRWIGKLLGALEQYHLDGNTAVVLVADHGEAFGEHRVAGRKLYYHGKSLYDELLRVPLIISVPGLKPRRIDTPVMLLDVAPTVLALVGAPRPDGFVGRSLAPALDGADLPPHDLFAQLLPAPYWKHRAMAMVTGDGRYKLILDLAPHRHTELYDLTADPHEQHDLARTDRSRAAALRKRLVEWLEVELPAR